MTSNNTQAIIEIENWLQRRLSNEQWHWLQERRELNGNENANRDLHITLGLIPRKLGRDDLELSDSELAGANSARKNWDPSSWTVDCAARMLVLAQLADQDQAGFADVLADLCRTADLAESITLYSGLPLYPASAKLDAQIGEGLRTNIRAVFESIAHNNPYPAEFFDQNRWNHMVLKALFIGSRLAPIQGLDDRANAELALILRDYAHERWAAGREITPELWRCVGRFATADMIDDLERVTQSDINTERQAGLLALSQTPKGVADQRIAEILAKFPTQVEQIADGTLTWDTNH